MQFTTDILEDGPVANKTLILQIVERYTEIDKKTKEFIKKEKFYGEVKVKLRDMFEKGRNHVFELQIIDEKEKPKGVISLKHSSLRNFHTFLDLHIKNGLNLVPIVAVDFSLANLTFDEN